MSSITSLHRLRGRRIAAWLAISALFFHALWPALASAQRSVSSSPFEICTAQGMRPGAGGLNDFGSHDPAAELLSGHCALCATGTSDLPVIHQTGLMVPNAPLSDSDKAGIERFAICIPSVRLSAHPRDPPIES